MKKILDKLSTKEKNVLLFAVALLLVFTLVQPFITILAVIFLAFALAWYTIYGKRRGRDPQN